MVKTKYGLVEGITKGDCTVYMGIPFAKPPIGKLAFKHPIPPDKWDGVLKCNHGSKNPIQLSAGFSVGNNSMDCLYLNVYVPNDIGDEKLPVMFWIYGGAYVQGAVGAVEEGSTTLGYNMERFAAETHTIVVTANYRLAVFGFLNLNSVCSDFDTNNGLFDQILALKFVNENIEAFGGNPENITIFGESAGGGSVLALMSMDAAKGMYHKAIAMSAPIEHYFTYEESAEYARLFLKGAGVNRASQLINMSQSDLDKAIKKHANTIKLKGDVRCQFSPVIDGVTLTDSPKVLAKQCNVPLLIGTTEEEGNLFVRNIPTVAMPALAKLFGFKVYKDADDYRQRVSNACTRFVFTDPLDEFLPGYKGKAWRYDVRYIIDGSKLRSCHASEIQFMFGAETTIDGVPIAHDDPKGALMRDIFSRFAYTGELNWNQYNGKDDIYII